MSGCRKKSTTEEKPKTTRKCGRKPKKETEKSE